jgi:hypothetical protein
MKYITLALFTLFLCPNLSYAYLDPSTGSIMFQMILGIVITFILTVKSWWNKTSRIFIKARDFIFCSK